MSRANADTLFGNYNTSYNILQSHATLADFYKNELKGDGQVSIKLAAVTGFGVPLDPGNPQDVKAAYRWNECEPSSCRAVVAILSIQIQSHFVATRILTSDSSMGHLVQPALSRNRVSN